MPITMLTPPASPPDGPGNGPTLAPTALLQILGWDGALPLLMTKAIWPNPPVAVGLVLVLSPPVAALIRAHIAWKQIAKRCGGRVPWVRQIAMAAAIVLLFAFEATVGALTFGQNIPAVAWCFPAGFYAVYLVMITLALRPTTVVPQSPSTSD